MKSLVISSTELLKPKIYSTMFYSTIIVCIIMSYRSIVIPESTTTVKYSILNVMFKCMMWVGDERVW